MTYLASELSKIKPFTPENVERFLIREGFVSIYVNVHKEIYDFYLARLAYFSKRVSNPKFHARWETIKAYEISQSYFYEIIGKFA
jgi:hypothetical protein